MSYTTDLWDHLASAAAGGRPIVLYGMGNGADKILAVCHERGIPISDFFASDGFVRGHSFHGKVVLSFSEMMEIYRQKSPIVLLSFASSRPDVLETIGQVANACELYIPDVPVCGEDLFDAAFARAHHREIQDARSLFCDEESRRVFDGIIEGKLSGRMEVIRATESGETAAYRDILKADQFKIALDLGAYNGDSIRALRRYAPHLQRVIAMEPDRRNFRKLEAYAAELAASRDPLTVIPLSAGAWSVDTSLPFRGSGNRNAGLSAPQSPHTPNEGKRESVTVMTPDRAASLHLAADARVDFIKYDVEGAERDALLGSRALIERDAPALLVSAYHRSDDLFTLPLLVRELEPSYRLYLRRMVGVPAWDINLYAVSDRHAH